MLRSVLFSGANGGGRGEDPPAVGSVLDFWRSAGCASADAASRIKREVALAAA